MSINKKKYDQLRFLDNTGKELIRVNNLENHTELANEKKLQNKSNRYYFLKTIQLSANDLYISPIDLNIEYNQIEIPFKPVIRLAIPIFDDLGNKRGILIINYLIKKLLYYLSAMSQQAPGQYMIINSKGYFIKGINPSDEWGFILTERKDKTFQNIFPEIWNKVSTQESGELRTDKGLFTYVTLYPDQFNKQSPMVQPRDPNNKYKMVYYVPKSQIKDSLGTNLKDLLRITLSIGLLLLILSTFISNLFANHKISQLKLHEREDNYKTVFETSLDGILIVDINSNQILQTNRAMCDMIGCDFQRIKSKTFFELLPPDQLNDLLDDLTLFLQGIRHNLPNIPLLSKTGSIIYVDVTGNNIIIDNTDCNVGFYRNITRRLQYEKDLIVMKDRAEIANRTKSEFLSIMNHELRTPLNAILGFSQLLQEEINNKNHLEYIQIILDSGKSLLTLINDILDLSNLESGNVSMNLKPVNIYSIIGQILSVYKMDIMEKKLDIEYHVDKTLPEKLLLDVKRLRQVLLNVVGNAIKFTDKGYVKIHVFRETEDIQPDKYSLVFAIEDSGIGIPQEYLDDIFKPFKQLDGNTNRKYSGTGLGLTICKRLVEMMNGEITLETISGQGTTFFIKLRDIPNS